MLYVNAMPDAMQTPVTAACVEHAARVSGVPPAVLLGVMAHEHGRVGRYHQNKNGTLDLGPMQLNTDWIKDNLKKLETSGITTYSILNNGCVNVYVGAWRLKTETTKHGMTWEAVGTYHSNTPKHKVRYVSLVSHEVNKLLNGQLSVQTVIDRANGLLR
ncbi:lytic transglycosylase domain-containing protein [Candidatus Methylospira mobilis]|uniref:lytic transglycosylase domain-containing protein n=1 Tax=Candidatus Methylospira mobilis TaxID=1808979 RepID=UPI0028EDF387|nr:lytic transglycosylase domain-containing protein [Candidatus Methylospira mobilis]WNV05922.1 lytic transglycosylase domain-containing protein [Candidatus Methylospira mobilis]